MPRRDVVVIGASAGGVEALSRLVAGLPAGLPAAVLVVVHIQPYAVSYLPEILSRVSGLPAAHARDGEVIVPGHIFVAPPDYHLLVREGRLALSRGPRENHARPAIDPLFRSAARMFGPRVIGVILSGALYDGSLGMMAVKARGGIAIVQDPREAAVDSMPRSALKYADVDYVLPVADIASLLPRLVLEPARTNGVNAMVDDAERMERIVAADMAEQAGDQRAEETTVFSCPDCGGVLWQGGNGPRLWFRCHLGHAYAPEMLVHQMGDDLEAALWSSLRLLKEKATLTRQLATRSRESGNEIAAERIDERAALDEQHAAVIAQLLESLPAPISQVIGVGGALEGDGRDD